MKFIKILLLLSLLILNAEAKKSKSDEIDHLALAALMLKDGHTARAADELAQADQNVTEFDFIRYYTLNALVLTKQSSYKVANENFSLSIKAGQTDKSVHMYMAQNSFKLENYKETISSIDKAGELALKKEYIEKFKKVMPSADVIRYFQIENRLQLGLEMRRASQIPLAMPKAEQ